MQIVKTDSGYISGAVLGEPDTPVYVFRGIPYAAPPIGDLRWKPPHPVAPWSGIRECTVYSKAAPQSTRPPYPGSTMLQSEDCLYLNVLTPAKKPSDRLPVMVWMHGGGFSFWSGNDSLYNGLPLPLGGVVLVTVNVRLGPLGFLAHSLLSKESPYGVSSNYGLLDLIAALKWVRRNISEFGGSSDNVTIFGESAGGATVAYLMSSPLAKGLFHRAISQSGGGTGAPLATAERIGEAVFAELDVNKAEDPLAAARAVPWQKIIEAGEAATPKLNIPLGLWRGIVDGYFMSAGPQDTFKAGWQNVVPLIIGGNSGETKNAILWSVATDLVAGASKAGGKAYAYVFGRVPDGWKNEGMAAACHTQELPYVFGEWENWTRHEDFFPLLFILAKQTGAASDRLALGDLDRKVSELMMTMWTNFAKSGNPSIPGVIDWPAWDETKDQYLYITEKPEVRSGFSKVGQK